MRRFTLHARLTKRCNADCSYCSSWQENALPYMSAADFARACDFIAEQVLPLMGQGGGQGHITIQYVGGEILTVPEGVLRECVLYARQRFGQEFAEVRDGCQTNLIGSEQRIARLQTLFGPRISSSIDRWGDSRTVGGSVERYKEMAAKGLATLARRRGLRAGVIFVVDGKGLAFARDEVAAADAEGHSITLRAVFHGGRAVGAAEPDEIRDLYCAIFDDWAMRGSVPVEPLQQLLVSRLATRLRQTDMAVSAAGCPFQKNCATVSLDLEPDGGLHVCLDMADSGQYPLGNAVEGRFETGVWEMLRQRRDHFDAKCRACTWLAECQGGCMSEAIHHTGSPHGRTALCTVWEGLFARIDALLDRHGPLAVKAWVDGLGQQRREAV